MPLFPAPQASTEATLPASSVVGEAVVVGDPVYVMSTGEVGRADTVDDDKARVVGITRTAGTEVTICFNGLCPGALKGQGIAGIPYYLATGGGLSKNPPASGNRIVQVGIAKNADDLVVRILDFGRR